MKVLLFIETKEGSPIGTSLELFTAAAAIGAEADAVLVGADMEKAAQEAAAFGGSAVCYVDAPQELTEDHIADAVAKVAGKGGYSAVLMAATTTGKILAPRIAARLDGGSVNDAIAIAAADGKITATRPVYGGTVRQEIKVNADVAVISIRGGSYDKPEKAASPASPVKADVQIDDGAVHSKILEAIAEAGEAVNLEDASIIVSGGRGMGSQEGFDLCKDLADVLGGVVGATRPAIENGWVNRQHQVGQSGKIVAPDLYIACGVSGATQHLSGMTGSKYIIAINKDADAPIFSVADIGIVGDAKAILPLFIEEMKKKKAEG